MRGEFTTKTPMAAANGITTCEQLCGVHSAAQAKYSHLVVVSDFWQWRRSAVRMTTLKVNGLTYRTVERDVEKLFDKYGKVNEVFIPKDKFSGKSRGFAFVRFIHKSDAKEAYEDMHKYIYDGRQITIEWSRKDDGHERRAMARRSRSRSRRRSRSRSRERRKRSRSTDRKRSRSRSERKKSRSPSPPRRVRSSSRGRRTSGGSRDREIRRERSGSRDVKRERSREVKRERSGSRERRRH